jgi:hypothetical protein
MRSRRRHTDHLALAMLAGALVGFAIGAMAGLSSNALDAPVLLPFAGAAIGVLVAGVVAGMLGAASGRERVRRQQSEHARGRLRLRDEARQGWIDGIDLTADAPPRPPPRQPRTRPRT